jgi:alkanesulfonate monooxygenase SsuD/methylene tetrahydromethanopterin reductase-like flavin-dependent oxidoreductase (luciferase family)
MHIATTVPTDDPARAGDVFSRLERIGYDTAFSFEAKHDPFLPLALASQATSTLRLGTAVAIAFARNPMVLANVGYDLQQMSGGRFALGLGSQIRPHIQNRFSETWSRPAARMRELVSAVRAIWDAWDGGSKLHFEGEFYRHTLMTPAFDPGPNPYGPPPVLDAHGYGDLYRDLNAMSKTGRWAEMAALVPDDFVEAIAVVGPRREIAAKISARADGITDRVSLVNNRNPDPDLFADIVADLRAVT